MPRNKDLKRLVRTRMEKTGEAYTTARAQLQKKTRQKSPDYAALAGMADAKVADKTGRTWAEWVKALDGHKAHELPHGKIARIVHETYDVPGWWSQTVTVGYERIKGIRALGQRVDGTFEATKSRTFPVPVTALFDAWNDAKLRRRWLKETGVKVRTATSPKTIRLDWTDGRIVAAWFESKGKSKSTVSLAHAKLPDRATAERVKQEWNDRLDALGEMLSEA